jgi:hypothetical protein
VTWPGKLYVGYLIGAGAMIAGGLVAVFFAVDAKGKSLEDIDKPLSVIDRPAEAIFRAGGAPGPLGSSRQIRELADRRMRLRARPDTLGKADMPSEGVSAMSELIVIGYPGRGNGPERLGRTPQHAAGPPGRPRRRRRHPARPQRQAARHHPGPPPGGLGSLKGQS